MGIYEAIACVKIFFDFDGTLVDSTKRLYELFQSIVPESHLTYNQYWEIRRNKIDHKKILLTEFSYTQSQYDFFVKEWMNKIELPEWLALDQPFKGVTEFLDQLSNRHTLYVVTARQFTDRVLQQIEHFGWANFFEQIFVTNQQKEKFELLKDIVVDNNDWLIGDTGHDIQTGKELGMKTAAVLSGFLGREKLTEYKPDIIIDKVQDFII